MISSSYCNFCNILFRFWTKGVCLLLSILGVTWIFGVFYINQDTVFFAYLFAVTNSVQGFSIFIFHCAFDPRVSIRLKISFFNILSTICIVFLLLFFLYIFDRINFQKYLEIYKSNTKFLFSRYFLRYE